MNENIYLIRPLANKVKDKYIYIYHYNFFDTCF